MNITFGSVCSGIEAASVAWHPLGFKTLWLSEIAKHPSNILKYRFPLTPNLGDMSTIPEKILNEEIETPDILIGGTPCQSFSIAGLRKGLDDDRGNLSLVFCKIMDNIDIIRREQGKNPSIFVWENVPGVLTSENGNSFGTILSAFAGGNKTYKPKKKWTTAGYIDGPIRRVAWRILDAKYWGVPQRRRRVFVISSLRERGVDPRKILHDTQTQTNINERIYNGEGRGILTSTCGTCGNANSRGISIVSERGWRSLTVTEEERKQGFPDKWVQIEGVPVSAQFKAIGNSMAVPVIKWIGERIKLELESNNNYLNFY